MRTLLVVSLKQGCFGDRTSRGSKGRFRNGFRARAERKIDIDQYISLSPSLSLAFWPFIRNGEGARKHYVIAPFMLLVFGRILVQIIYSLFAFCHFENQEGRNQ
jgi:hypothetical protein